MFKQPQIEKWDIYYERAMKSMEERASKQREDISKRYGKSASTQKKTKEEIELNKRKDIELEKVKSFNYKINHYLRTLTRQFPKFPKLNPVYTDLIETSGVSIQEIKDKLDKLLNLANEVDKLTQKTEFKIRYVKTQKTCGYLLKKYFGRVKVLMQREEEIFSDLEQVRKFMNKLPTFKDIFTVSIGGFPNVGKSTLLKGLTGSDVEIQPYPFTTKGLMFGYLSRSEKEEIQLIDTPGLLGREKNNDIEERAELILAKYCSTTIFVFDITQSCGYSYELQQQLFEKVQSFGKEITIYLSKTDIYDSEAKKLRKECEKTYSKYTIIDDKEQLRELLFEKLDNHNEEFNIKKIKRI